MTCVETKRRLRRAVNDFVFANLKLTGHNWRDHVFLLGISHPCPTQPPLISIAAHQVKHPQSRRYQQRPLTKITARAACPQHRSSNENSLGGRVLVESTGVIPTSQIHGSRTDT